MISIFESDVRLSTCEPAKAGSGNRADTDELAFTRWAETMSHGRFEEGWRINDDRGCHWPSAHRLWDGRDMRNRNLTVRSLHGLGDAVQMLRYAPRLGQLGKSVCYQVPAELEPLMPYFDGVSESVSARISRDAEIEMMELPYFLRTQPTDLPLRTNYLVLPGRILGRCRSSMGSARKTRIGLAWAGGEWDRERWIPFGMLRELIYNERFEWWNLQGQPARAEALDSPLRTHHELCNGGLMGLAATIGSLDLILTVDTLAAHLAGALGVPTWLMLKQEADWRWMIGRSDSPWYPSLRIFRQPAPGNWRRVIQEIEEALGKRE